MTRLLQLNVTAADAYGRTRGLGAVSLQYGVSKNYQPLDGPRTAPPIMVKMLRQQLAAIELLERERLRPMGAGA